MNSNILQTLQRFWHKDGWLVALLAASVLLCLLTNPSSTDASPTAEEARLAQVLSAMDGAGEVEVALYYGSSGNEAVPCGAVIVADGAGDVAVRLRLSRAVATLMGIDENRVEVFLRKGGSSHGQLDP